MNEAATLVTDYPDLTARANRVEVENAKASLERNRPTQEDYQRYSE